VLAREAGILAFLQAPRALEIDAVRGVVMPRGERPGSPRRE
jgi:hypothetical protein